MKTWGIEWKTGHGIREKLVALKLIPGTREYKNEYMREYKKLHAEDIRLAQSKYYASRPKGYAAKRSRYYRSKARAKTKALG